jgi:hypothetical protein
MIKVKLNGKLCIGKHKTFFHRSKGNTIKPAPITPATQVGLGYKSISSNATSKINIEPNKKLDKFINFKL